jgi:hypothetical protein
LRSQLLIPEVSHSSFDASIAFSFIFNISSCTLCHSACDLWPVLFVTFASFYVIPFWCMLKAPSDRPDRAYFIDYHKAENKPTHRGCSR